MKNILDLNIDDYIYIVDTEEMSITKGRVTYVKEFWDFEYYHKISIIYTLEDFPETYSIEYSPDIDYFPIVDFNFKYFNKEEDAINCINFYKSLDKPLYKIDVLNCMKNILIEEGFGKTEGLCKLFSKAFRKLYFVNRYNLQNELFPKFTYENASKYNTRDKSYSYWWPISEWDTGRLDFLKWLMEQYKDDKTDLREYIMR